MFFDDNYFPIGYVKLQLHDAIYRLRFYSNSLIRILSLSNSHNNVASLQKNRADKSHRVIVALAPKSSSDTWQLSRTHFNNFTWAIPGQFHPDFFSSQYYKLILKTTVEDGLISKE